VARAAIPGVLVSGKVKSYNAEKGFGFIDCADTFAKYGRDVFLHKEQADGLAVGDPVLFTVEINPRGQPQARKVEKIRQAIRQKDEIEDAWAAYEGESAANVPAPVPDLNDDIDPWAEVQLAAQLEDAGEDVDPWPEAAPWATVEAAQGVDDPWAQLEAAEAEAEAATDPWASIEGTGGSDADAWAELEAATAAEEEEEEEELMNEEEAVEHNEEVNMEKLGKEVVTELDEEDGEAVEEAVAHGGEDSIAATDAGLLIQRDAKRLGLNPLFVSTVSETRRQKEQLEKDLVDADSMSPKELSEKASALSGLTNIIALYDELNSVDTQLREAQELARGGDDLAEEFQEEASMLQARKAELAEQFQLAMLPKDAADQAKGIILEIRPGVGGNEAALWAEDLMNMYTKYCDLEGLACQALDVDRREGGGILGASLSVQGDGVYTKLKFESGVHRVQRVPDTERAGRVHTSTATVAIMPEVEETELDFDEKDIDFQFVRAGGKGGQNVNKLSTACRALHIPSGISVFSRGERSQMQNKKVAIRLIMSKLQQRETEASEKELASIRSSQLGSGAGRSEKIRTYTFKENRVSDHRLNRNFNLDQMVSQGCLQEPVRLMQLVEQQERLRDLERSMAKPAA